MLLLTEVTEGTEWSRGVAISIRMARGVTSLKRHKQKLEEGRKEAWESGKSTQAGGTTKFKGERLPACWVEGKES